MFVLKLTKFKIKTVMVSLIFISLLLLHNRPIGVSSLDLPAPLEQVETNEKVMAFTVNVDWGEEYIPPMLEIFDEYQVKVTFFVTGRWAQKHPDLLKIMAERGHQIENHGYSHPHPDQLSVTRNKEEITKTEKIIWDIIGRKTQFYAPPYGERGKSGLLAAEELGYTTVLWTLDTIDWKSDSTPELITKRIINPQKKYGVQPEKKGAIVLMHPKENTVKALPQILSSLSNEQYMVITLEKLITFQGSGYTTP
ncbi:MAG: polysaccharide deacetylase family protein [Peptococcaceae bacterium]|nr:polysaccharide deacetylase family protein [Peptococcaceae bacterium]